MLAGLILSCINSLVYQLLRNHSLAPHSEDKQGNVRRAILKKPLKRILYYNPANFQQVRGILELTHLEGCEFSNCAMSFNQSDLDKSDAVIFHFIYGYHNISLNSLKQTGQVWIWAQHERPTWHHQFSTPTFRSGIKGVFNWTMTYSEHSDIYFPYGIAKLKSNTNFKRDYHKIAREKSRDAFWVNSHCHTEGKREMYVDTLKRYIDVDVYGECGKKWNCGRKYAHDLDGCFDVLNTTYKFYLAFENAFCQEYISEKFFENFEYDVLLVSRGDVPGSRSINISKSAYIRAGDLKSAHELGQYLRRLSSDIDEYAKMLEEKDKYYVVRYKTLFERAMCEVCKRLNNVERYRSVYDDVYEWMNNKHECFPPKDI